jgi:hypothetical protein
MAKSKTKTGRMSELIILAFVIAGTLLIFAELGVNVANELDSYQNSNTSIQKGPTPTPIPTLTREEYEQYLKEHPIGG